MHTSLPRKYVGSECKVIMRSIAYSKRIFKLSKMTKIFAIIIFTVLNMKLISCKKSHIAPFPAPYAKNINVFNAKLIKTPTPLLFLDNPIQLSKVFNTGSSLFFFTMETEKTQLVGGILNHTYNFFQSEFFWDLDLDFDTGNKINGIGSPVQVVFTYFNTKYGNMETAVTKNDGIAQFILFVYVRPFPNPLFYPMQFLVDKIKKADSSMVFPQYFAYNWFFIPSITQDYYVLPGTYTDPKFSEKYSNPTVGFLIRFPLPYISYEQFNATFGSLRNKAGQPYSNKIKFAPGNPESLKHVKGVRLSYK